MIHGTTLGMTPGIMATATDGAGATDGIALITMATTVGVIPTIVTVGAILTITDGATHAITATTVMPALAITASIVIQQAVVEGTDMPATEALVVTTTAMGSMAHTTHVPGTTTPHGVTELRACRHTLLARLAVEASAVAVVVEASAVVVAAEAAEAISEGDKV